VASLPHRAPLTPSRAERFGWRRVRALLPWLLGAAIVAWLLLRLPFDAVVAALAGGRWGVLVAYVTGELAILLLVDAWATVVTLRRCGGSPPFRDVLAMRGATYLLNLLHFGAGQGAFGWYLLVTQGLALVLVLAAGLLLAPPWLARPALPLAALALAGIVVYLAVVAMRPAWAQRVPLLRPLLDAGLRGHLVAGAARVPHMALLALLNWGVYRVWGMPVPLRFGLAVWPLLMAVSALPITPSGLGTVQAMQVSLFAEWAPGGDLASRQAAVLALTIAAYALALLLQALIGAVALRREQGASTPS
jgi:hypothetical protein